MDNLFNVSTAPHIRSSINQFYPGYPGRACPDRFFQGDQCRYLDYMYCLRVVDDFADPGKRSVVI